MVERILDMIGRGVGIDQLFISTFTVKAAGELKERLEKRLTEQLGEVETDEERAFLSDQIAKIGTADIGTMDAFTQKLVNQYGYLLGVSPIFRIMTDPAEQTLMKMRFIPIFSMITCKGRMPNFSKNWSATSLEMVRLVRPSVI